MKKLLLLALTTLLLISCGGSQQASTDIINPDADFLYFYGATCPHCQELNKMLDDWDYLSKISVEKREVYYNDVNRDSFLAVTKKLGLSERDTGVPFVLDKATGKHVTGVTDAFELLISKIWEAELEAEITTETDNTSSTDEVIDTTDIK